MESKILELAREYVYGKLDRAQLAELARGDRDEESFCRKLAETIRSFEHRFVET